MLSTGFDLAHGGVTRVARALGDSMQNSGLCAEH